MNENESMKKDKLQVVDNKELKEIHGPQKWSKWEVKDTT